jgi:hypothetical protein
MPAAQSDVIEHREIELRFLTPRSNNRIIFGGFSQRGVCVRQVRNVEQQIALAFLRKIGLPNEFRDFIADLPDPIFQGSRIFASAARAADLFAQSFAVGVALLERGFHFPALRIDFQDFIDPAFIAATASRQPALHEIRLFTNEANVEHPEQLSALLVDRKSKAHESA